MWSRGTNLARLQALNLWPKHSGSDLNGLIRNSWQLRHDLGVTASKRSNSSFENYHGIPQEVSIDVVIASVLFESGNISLFRDEQTTALKAFHSGKDVFALILTGFGKSLNYQHAPCSSFLLLARDGRWQTDGSSEYSLKVPALFQTVPRTTSQMVLSDKPSGVSVTIQRSRFEYHYFILICDQMLACEHAKLND